MMRLTLSVVASLLVIITPNSLRAQYQLVREDPFAQLSSTLKTKQAAACDGSVIHMRCPKDTKVSIQYVEYGRSANLSLCPPDLEYPSRPPLTGEQCRVADSVRGVQDRCQGQEKCQFRSNFHNLMGRERKDDCPGVRRHMEVLYKCKPGVFRSKVVCGGETVSLDCPVPSQRLAILSASFKSVAKGGLYCYLQDNQGGRLYDSMNEVEECESASATQPVLSACHGKQSCSLTADPRDFNITACRNLHVFIKTTYTCADMSVFLPRYLNDDKAVDSNNDPFSLDQRDRDFVKPDATTAEPKATIATTPLPTTTTTASTADSWADQPSKMMSDDRDSPSIWDQTLTNSHSSSFARDETRMDDSPPQSFGDQSRENGGSQSPSSPGIDSADNSEDSYSPRLSFPETADPRKSSLRPYTPEAASNLGVGPRFRLQTDDDSKLISVTAGLFGNFKHIKEHQVEVITCFILTILLAVLSFLIFVMIRKFKQDGSHSLASTTTSTLSSPSNSKNKRPLMATNLDTVDGEIEEDLEELVRVPLPEPQFLSSATAATGGSRRQASSSVSPGESMLYSTLGRSAGRLLRRSDTSSVDPNLNLSNDTSRDSAVVRYSTIGRPQQQHHHHAQQARVSPVNSLSPGMAMYSGAVDIATLNGIGMPGNVLEHEAAWSGGTVQFPVIYSPASTGSNHGSSCVDMDLADPRSIACSHNSNFNFYE